MSRLHRKKIAILGASRGIGREIALACAREGGVVLAVARGQDDLAELARQSSAIDTLALDAAAEDAPTAVFAKMRPDVLVIAAGALPPTAPLPDLTWTQFAVNWETDVRLSFEFCKRALREPLPLGAVVILLSSGAALGGSPISGGYAGAKRTQMFIAQYAQRESNRLGLKLRFIAVAPQRIMPETELGSHAVRAYAGYLGISPKDFVESLSGGQSRADVARAVVSLAEEPFGRTETALIVSSSGLVAMGAP
jgi:NAD(P)-dependent dehydrogenase (short-subunit alcohol dehydrogenase family)